MKKILPISLLLFLLSFNLYGQEQPYQGEGGLEIKEPAETMVNFDFKRAEQHIQTLTQEVNDLESVNRDQDQRIRVLEHNIDSIRTTQNQIRSK